MSMHWDQKAVQRYIDEGVQESLTLDYKAADALGKSDGKKSEITKDVSAMANSAGGIIIYGIKEFDEADKRHLPEKLSVVDRTQFSKEWLEQVINTIQPRITGITIHPVDIDTGANYIVYVVDIPQSTTAHQARDFRYYKRFNFESTPMYDYEVRDVMNRVTLPDVKVEFSFTSRQENNRRRYILGILVKNQGIRAVEKYKLQFTFPNYGVEIIMHSSKTLDHNNPYFGQYDVI
jgi:predicted HTH transcriptional regulator